MADEYVDYPIVFDETALYNNAIAYIQSYFPTWTPKTGSLIDLLLRACAQMGAVGAEVASEVPFDIFTALGPMAGVLAQAATPATVNSEWTVQDANGYRIDANTAVGLLSESSPDPVSFQTLNDLVIPPGSTTGTVQLIALVPGANGNNLDTIIRADNLGFVTAIALLGTSANGNDAELITDFANRLSQEFELLTDTPILGSNFAILAQSVEGVYRSAEIDNYNPGDNTYNNDKMVCVCNIDTTGAWVGADIDTAVVALAESKREVNFVCNTDEPTVTEVDVSYTAYIEDATISAATETAINAALTSYLSAANWGIPQPQGETPSWVNTSKVRINNVIVTIESIDGVVGTNNVKIAIHGSGLGAADITLPGAFPLPSIGTITATITVLT